TALASSSTPGNTSPLGTPAVTFTATVLTDAPASGAPVNNAGTVTFRDNGVPIAAPVSVNANGSASVSKTYSTFADLGSHTIDATYNPPTVGVINYLTSAATSLIHNVQQKAAIT